MGNLAENNVIEMDYWTPEDLVAGLCTLAEVGRPKPPIREARRLAQQATVKAVKALIDVAEQNEDLPAKVKAAQALLDRGWGKAEVTNVNINPPEREWPAWLTSRRLAYQEASQYAEDIMSRELQGNPVQLDAPETAAPLAEPHVFVPQARSSDKPLYNPNPKQEPFVPPERKQWKVAGGYLAHSYTKAPKSLSPWANVLPQGDKVKTPDFQRSTPTGYVPMEIGEPYDEERHDPALDPRRGLRPPRGGKPPRE
jgi:hypothetical protein